MPFIIGTTSAVGALSMFALANIIDWGKRWTPGSSSSSAFKKKCSPKEFCTIINTRDYRALERVDASDLCLRVSFLPKDKYIDQQFMSSRQYTFAFRATDFAKFMETKHDCSAEDVFRHAGWNSTDIAAKRAAKNKAVAVVWKNDTPLDESNLATWERVFSVLPIAVKNSFELKHATGEAITAWSESAQENNQFVKEVQELRPQIEKLVSVVWDVTSTASVKDYLKAPSVEGKVKVARQVIAHALGCDKNFRGDGLVMAEDGTGSVQQFLVRSQYSAKDQRFYKFGELEPKIGYFALRWAEDIKMSRAKSDASR